MKRRSTGTQVSKVSAASAVQAVCKKDFYYSAKKDLKSDLPLLLYLQCKPKEPALVKAKRDLLICKRDLLLCKRDLLIRNIYVHRNTNRGCICDGRLRMLRSSKLRRVVCVCVCVCVRVCVCVCVHGFDERLYLYMYMYAHTHTHTHTVYQARLSALSNKADQIRMQAQMSVNAASAAQVLCMLTYASRMLHVCFTYADVCCTYADVC